MVKSVDLVIFFDTWSETKKSYLDNHMNTNFINNFGYNHSLYSIPFCSPHTLDLQYSVQQSLCHMQPLPISVPQPYFIRHLEHISQSQWDAFGHIILLCNSTKAWPLWNQYRENQICINITYLGKSGKLLLSKMCNNKCLPFRRDIKVLSLDNPITNSRRICTINIFYLSWKIKVS